MQYACSPDSSISFKLMNNDIQQNKMTGVYAIAFAVSLVFCKEPAYSHYDSSKMRPHPSEMPPQWSLSRKNNG